MTAQTFPQNEVERVSRLRSFNILDTAPDEGFDRITRMATCLFGCPIAVVSLIDEERQWFKSARGIDIPQIARAISLCEQVVAEGAAVEVEDTRVDSRFSHNPLVTGEAQIVFYAGAPLYSPDGYVLGTICIADRTPRQLSAGQKALLLDLAACAADQIRLHRSLQDSAALVRQSQELRESEQRLLSVIEGTRAGTWEWNVQSGEAWFNERWAQMIGYTIDELAPVNIATWTNLAHPDDRGRSAALLKKHFAGELAFYDCKCRIKHKSGHWVWVHDRGKVYSWTQDGSPLMMSGTHADITEHMAMRQALEAQHTQLHNMLSNLPGTVYRCVNDDKWTMQFISDDVLRLTGYPAAEFLPRKGGKLNFNHVMHPEDAARIGAFVGDPECNDRFRLEYRIRHADGRYRWVEELGRGERDTQGNVAYLDGFIWDITERKQALADLEAERNKFSSLYNMAPVAIAAIRCDDCQFIDGNAEFRKLFFRQSGDDTDFGLAGRLEEISSMCIEIRSSLQDGRYGPRERRCITQNGDARDIMLSAVRVSEASGLDLIWVIAQDITHQKLVDRMKNELIAVVSHELRTPLTSIIGALGLIRKRLGGELSPFRDLIEIAYNNGMRLNMLVNDLLDMEKLLAGKMAFTMAHFDLAELLSQARAENQGFADQYGVEMVFEFPEQPIQIAVDRLRFQQIMSNLLSNAAKFSHPGGKVLVRAQKESDVVRVSVQDHGRGIPENKRDRIFEKFSQIDSPNTRKAEGTGLGLAITRELVERMNGSISFTSQEHLGTTFFVVLPLPVSDSKVPIG